MSDGRVDWQALRAPFDPAEVDFRPQRTFEKNGQRIGVIVAYIDARVVQDRLDAIVGPDHWSFEWTPLKVRDDGVVLSAKGTITIYSLSKSDIGDASDHEPSKGCVSDAFKRAAVMWGIGRYLYGLGVMYAPVEAQGKSYILPDAEVTKLRAKLGGSHTRADAPVTRQEAQQTAQPPKGSLAAVLDYLDDLGYRAMDQKQAFVLAAGLPWKTGIARYTPAEMRQLQAFMESEQQRKSA